MMRFWVNEMALCQSSSSSSTNFIATHVLQKIQGRWRFIAKLVAINCFGELSLLRRMSADIVANQKVTLSSWWVFEMWFTGIDDKTRWTCVGRLDSTSSNDTVSLFWVNSSQTSVLLHRDVFEKTPDRCEVHVLRNCIGRISVDSACVTELVSHLACFRSVFLFQFGGIKFCLCIECTYEFYENEWKFYVSVSIEYWIARLFSMIIFPYF